MPVATIGERLYEWHDQNPFRVWRNEQGLSIRSAAGLMQRSSSTVQAWEYGSSEPDFAHLAKHMSVKQPWLRKQWQNWLARRPKV